MNLPWWLRMVFSVIVLAIGCVLMFLSISGRLELGRNPLVLPGVVLLLGSVMFGTSFPYDRNKYNF